MRRNDMFRKTAFLLTVIIIFATTISAQQLDGRPFDPARDPNPDMYLHSWMDSRAADDLRLPRGTGMCSQRAIRLLLPRKVLC